MAVRPFDPTFKKAAHQRALEWLARRRAMTWLFINVGNRIDPMLMRATRGRVKIAPGSPTVLLTHTGARSGKRRTTPLAYFTEGDRVVLIASKGGADHHPAWYHNLMANPEVEASTDGRPEPYLAREAEGAERERLWDLATTLYSGYADYQDRARDHRRIPVIVLEPLVSEPS
jgi:deazaflavin-dependent oxidoreductase (nitroreductase family)